MQQSFSTDKSGFAWTITKDHTPEVCLEEFKDAVSDRTGEVWPDGMMIPWSYLREPAEAIKNHPQAIVFRVFNSEDKLWLEGVIVGDISGLPAATSKAHEPFDSICRGWKATVEFFIDGAWQRFEYQGFEENEWNPYDQ